MTELPTRPAAPGSDPLGKFPPDLVLPSEAQADDAQEGHAPSEAQRGGVVPAGGVQEGAGERGANQAGEGDEEEAEAGAEAAKGREERGAEVSTGDLVRRPRRAEKAGREGRTRSR